MRPTFLLSLISLAALVAPESEFLVKPSFEPKSDVGKCFSSFPEIINGTALEDLLAQIDSRTIDGFCDRFRETLPCGHQKIIEIRDNLKPDDISLNQTLANYHTMFYACTRGLPLFKVRNNCATLKEQETKPDGRCFRTVIFDETMTNETKETLRCDGYTFYYECVRNITKEECGIEAHHLNLNVWKIAKMYYNMVSKCRLDFSEETVFAPNPLSGSLDGMKFRELGTKRNKRSKRVKISGIVTIDEV